MDYQELRKLIDKLLVEYEKSEGFGILFYSTDKNRDFELLRKKIDRYRVKFDKQFTDDRTQT